MAERQIVIKVDEDILREFRAECIRRKTTPTKMVAHLMAEQLQAWHSAANGYHMPTRQRHAGKEQANNA